MKQRIKSEVGKIRKQNTQPEQQKENRIQKSDDSVSSFWNNFKSTSVLIMGVLGGERESEKLKTYLKK